MALKRPMDKQVKQLLAEGWRFTNGTHLKYTSPHGYVWIVSRSASDGRAYLNCLKDLEKVKKKEADHARKARIENRERVLTSGCVATPKKPVTSYGC